MKSGVHYDPHFDKPDRHGMTLEKAAFGKDSFGGKSKTNKELHKEVNERYSKKHEKAHLKFQGIKSKALKHKIKESHGENHIGKALEHYGHLI